MWSSGHTCQKLFEYAQWTRLFEVTVRASEDDGQPALAEESKAAIAVADALVRSLERDIEEKRQQRKVAGAFHRSEANSWLQHTA